MSFISRILRILAIAYIIGIKRDIYLVIYLLPVQFTAELNISKREQYAD